MAVLLAAVASLLLAARWPLVRRTTLVGPWSWTLAATLALAAVEVLASWKEPGAGGGWSAARFAAAALTLCPIMALLGAKRPQDRAWTFVVLSLWIVLVLPAAEIWLLRPGHPLEIQWLRALFLVSLIVLGLINALPTRQWLSGLAACGAQLLLLLPYLPWPQLIAPHPLWGLALWTAALAAAPRRRRQVAHELDHVWLDFRDQFGTFWAARVAERMNAAARQYGWQLTLGWSGFRLAQQPAANAELPPAEAASAKRTLRNLLRRFVPPAWMAERWDSPYTGRDAK